MSASSRLHAARQSFIDGNFEEQLAPMQAQYNWQGEATWELEQSR